MSTHREGEKIDLQVARNRQLMIEALESGQHKQRRGAIGKWWVPDDSVCWYGLGLRLMGEQKPSFAGPSVDTNFLAFTKWLGISEVKGSHFVNLNDTVCDFPGLAHHMRQLPPPLLKE